MILGGEGGDEKVSYLHCYKFFLFPNKVNRWLVRRKSGKSYFIFHVHKHHVNLAEADMPEVL